MIPYLPASPCATLCIAAGLSGLLPALAAAQDPDAVAILSRIRAEAEESSSIVEDIFQLTDAVGPRVTGSPSLLASEAWVSERLRALGLQNVRIERNPPMDVGGGLELDPPGWSWSRLTVQQLEPWSQSLTGVPLLYSPATRGTVTGDVIVAPLPPPEAAAVDSFIRTYRGRLRERFVLLRDEEAPIDTTETVRPRRYSADELLEMANATPPAPTASAPQRSSTDRSSEAPPEPLRNPFEQQDRLFEFLGDEGVLALVGSTPNGHGGGTLRLQATPTPPILAEQPPPMFDLAPEHFNRLLRLAQRNLAVRLEVRLESTFHEHVGTENVLAEIPGGDRADEIVMVGAHLDSWHGGTGATDNAVGVAMVLEAVRILTTLGVPLRRTVAVAFWGGEELGLAGSKAYVERYLFDQGSGELTAAGRRVSCYINLDYGGGRIRGIFLQGNPRLKSLFDEWLTGIGDGSLVATLRSTLGSDQASFERVGIPGLSFIQDPLNYEHRTHHTNMDDRDYVPLDDAAYNAMTLASIIYRVANAEEQLPRKPRP